ncbi:hypothetical protein GA0074704_5024 [Micromonospora siamensis]|uniref:Uncharacterized protein n=1 Tax=Micromonospora siamensis TaxID=299152 RepID=A0A1C5JV31_9ACTN|nr:hypothetical protein GA0074704_5024 [Micromonospora siamensis]
MKLAAVMEIRIAANFVINGVEWGGACQRVSREARRRDSASKTLSRTAARRA